LGKKAKKKLIPEQHEHCALCYIGQVQARLDQALDAYVLLTPYVANGAGIEAGIRLHEARFWMSELSKAADEQGVQHSCEQYG
jgi:hypothetical protein